MVGGEAPFDDRIFDNQPGVTATITGLTITGGKAPDNADGIYNQGDLTLDKVAVKNNTAAASTAGGILSAAGTLDLIDSTVSGNSAAFFGGVYQFGGTANITNSTISGNQAAEFNGGVLADGGTLMNIRNSTITSNTSGVARGSILTTDSSTVVVKNTIVAGNSQDNCDTTTFPGGTITSQGNNLSSDDSCNFTKSTDKRNTNPRLGPLQDNGGPTDTRALLERSPAIDAGGTPFPPTDQRGVARPQGAANDIGAYEKKRRGR